MGVARYQPSWCGEGLSVYPSAVLFSAGTVSFDVLARAIGSFPFISYQLGNPAKRDRIFSSRKIREIPCSLSPWLGAQSVLVLFTVARGRGVLALQWPEDRVTSATTTREKEEAPARRAGWGASTAARGSSGQQQWVDCSDTWWMRLPDGALSLLPFVLLPRERSFFRLVLKPLL